MASSIEKTPLGDMHPGLAATTLVREALGQFKIASGVDLRYTGMKRISGSGAHRLTDGIVWVQANLRSLSGARHYVDVPIIVHDGHMVHPEVLVHEGQTRVMAQSTFDDIIGRGESYRRSPERKHVYSPPQKYPKSRHVTPMVGRGLYK